MSTPREKIVKDLNIISQEPGVLEKWPIQGLGQKHVQDELGTSCYSRKQVNYKVMSKGLRSQSEEALAGQR